MSKNITIAEGTQAKNFNGVSKIRTNVIGGGTQNWIPEDEAGRYANLEEISIDENGTYRASDEGLDGFSKVTVNVPESGGVEPRLITKTITQNGTYNADSDGADGYSQVIVSVEATHGRTIVSGLNNAVVGQRISTRDFFDDLDEQEYAAVTSYDGSDRSKMWCQTRFREYGWLKAWSGGIMDILNCNNLILVGQAGFATYFGIRPLIMVWMIGVFDDSAMVTLTDVSSTGFKIHLSDPSKFTGASGIISDYTYIGGSGGSGSCDVWKDVKRDLDNHTTARSADFTIQFGYSSLNLNYPHTPILTNLTGGTIA